MSPNGVDVYYMEGTALHRTETVAARDKILFTGIGDGFGRVVIRWDVTMGEIVELEHCDITNHFKANPGGPEVAYNVYWVKPDIDKPLAHPHADLSDDGRLAVCSFTTGGAPHIAVAEIPDDMRERLSA